MTDRRTPLGRVLGSGSAKEGTGHWWTQRVSAVALVILGGWFAVALAFYPVLDYEAASAWLARPLSGVLLLLLVLAAGWHSHLGVQVVIEDYVHQPFIKVAALVMSRLLHAFAAAAGALALVRLTLGGGA